MCTFNAAAPKAFDERSLEQLRFDKQCPAMIAAYIPNLMDRSRFGGSNVCFVAEATEAADAALVIVDLDRCADVDAFAGLEGHTVGFGAHVDGERLQAATAAGFDDVMARSAFFRRLPSLLAEEGAGENG